MQLAFTARVQEQLLHRLSGSPSDHAKEDATGAAARQPRSRWLLLRQVLILAKFRSVAEQDFPDPTTPTLREHTD